VKYIRKTVAPADFVSWCDTQRALGLNYNYGRLPNPEKGNLHQSLVEEQGSICGYTMKRVSKADSHIEHIKPQHICLLGEDLDYHNLLACFPRGGLSAKCPFGAQYKDNWWDDGGRDFVSPLNSFCELKFTYNLKGEISPTNSKSIPATKTIEVLKLDEASLTEDRRKSIEVFIYGEDPISPDDADKAIDAIYKPDAHGILYEFCIAIHDALYEYLDIFKKIT